MKLSDFDFDLPNDLIALRPSVPRTAARLLVAENGEISDRHFTDILDYLRPGDRLILNDTKVIPARLQGMRIRQSDNGETRAAIGVNLLSLNDQGQWLALAKPSRRVNIGETIAFGSDLSAVVLDKSSMGLTLEFNKSGSEFDTALQQVGQMPLPPYIAAQRPADERDNDDYQTVFAKQTGAVAAPTASLHFDNDLLDRLAEMGVQTTTVTLHVGAGTFLPVTADNIKDHKMHSEWGQISAETAAAIAEARAKGGRVIAVGTTSLRILEACYQQHGAVIEFAGETDIFITPGYEFGVIDALLTNFHLPKSTLLMLVSAFAGMQKIAMAYRHAIANDYRFFSYGDACFMTRNPSPDIIASIAAIADQ